MKKKAYFVFCLVLLVACEDDEEPNPGTSAKEQFIQSYDKTRWKITEMISDVPREIEGQTSVDWLSLFPDCRKDNIYIFDFTEASIDEYELDILEGDSECPTGEPSFIDRAFFLSFNEDFNQINVDPRRDWALVKLYHIPFSEERSYVQTWKFISTTQDSIRLEISIPDSEDVKMLETSATLQVKMVNVD